MNGNKFNRNFENSNDAKKIQDIIGKNHTRSITSPFSYGKNTSNLSENSSEDVTETTKTQSQGGLASALGANNLLSSLKNGKFDKNSSGKLKDILDKKLRIKILMIGIPIFIIIFLILLVVIITASSENNRDINDQYNSVVSDSSSNSNQEKKSNNNAILLSNNIENSQIINKNTNKSSNTAVSFLNYSNYNYSKVIATTMSSSNITNSLPKIEDENFETYFDNNVKDYLLNYLYINNYCGSLKDECDKSDAFTFYKRYLEVIIAFERGEGAKTKGKYPIDTGLLFETMAYYRSDEELFLGATEETKGNSWFSWIQNLFAPKTDEISKLANKMWREKKTSDGKKWEFSLEKYVAFLMYGDTMNDKSNPKVGTNSDLNIKASNVKYKNENGNGVTSNKHTYKYGNCTITDSDYEGDIKSGYIYMRFKDSQYLNVSDSMLETKIAQIIQEILNKTARMHGDPSYCVDNTIGSGYGTNICSYSVDGEVVSDLKVQLLTCEKSAKDTKPIEGEPLVDLEKYVTGVLYQENGGASYTILKTHAVVIRSFVIAKAKQNFGGVKTASDGTKYISIRNCTWDQVYCDPDKGCWSDVRGGEAGTANGQDATVHSGHDSSKNWSRKTLSESSEVRKAVNEVAGELLIDKNGKTLLAGYKMDTLNKWKELAETTTDYVAILLSSYEKANDIKKLSCETVGAEASGVAKNERMKYLFPNGVPTTKAEMDKYITTIEVPINNENGQKTTMKLNVHKKLAQNYINAFTEIQKIGFKIKKSATGAYVWRKMATNKNKQSYHSYGSALDVNWGDNPLVYSNSTSSKYQPGINPYSVTTEVVNIFKKNGFYWGGNWSSYKDYMHFSYTDN